MVWKSNSEIIRQTIERTKQDEIKENLTTTIYHVFADCRKAARIPKTLSEIAFFQ